MSQGGRDRKPIGRRLDMWEDGICQEDKAQVAQEVQGDVKTEKKEVRDHKGKEDAYLGMGAQGWGRMASPLKFSLRPSFSELLESSKEPFYLFCQPTKA
jgi:hypothetical protein